MLYVSKRNLEKAQSYTVCSSGLRSWKVPNIRSQICPRKKTNKVKASKQQISVENHLKLLSTK